MNKQILFRAISREPESQGQIIYGSLVNLSKPDKKPFYKIRDSEGKYSAIDQSSISQYIGQQDLKGVPIFELDIINSQPVEELRHNQMLYGEITGNLLDNK